MGSSGRVGRVINEDRLWGGWGRSFSLEIGVVGGVVALIVVHNFFIIVIISVVVFLEVLSANLTGVRLSTVGDLGVRVGDLLLAADIFLSSSEMGELARLLL